jgi:hypothetical protein
VRVRMGSDTHASEKSIYDRTSYFTNDHKINITTNEHTYPSITRVNSSHTIGNGIRVTSGVPVTAAEGYQVKTNLPVRYDKKITEIKRVQSSTIHTYDPMSPPVQ